MREARSRTLPPAVRLLILGALMLTLSRGVTLPFLVVFFSVALDLSVPEIGLLLGGSLLLSVVIGMYGGYIVDRQPRLRLLLTLIVVFGMSFIGVALAREVWAGFIAITILNAAYAIFDVASKACIADLVPEDRRTETFSLRYTAINLGYAVGPTAGAMLATRGELLPFVASAVVAVCYLTLLAVLGKAAAFDASRAAVARLDFASTVRVLRADRRLLMFALGGVLSAFVVGQFAAYLSQYLVATTDPETTYRIIAHIVTTNAIVVIASQYWIGRTINHDRLMPWLFIGLACLIVGELGFAASVSAAAWILFMIVFSLGETIVLPAEYMVVDRIAPGHLRGSYYAVQNVGNIGAALGPIACGYLIDAGVTKGMFYVLAAAAVLSGGCYVLGHRLGAVPHERRRSR